MVIPPAHYLFHTRSLFKLILVLILRYEISDYLHKFVGFDLIQLIRYRKLMDNLLWILVRKNLQWDHLLLPSTDIHIKDENWCLLRLFLR